MLRALVLIIPSAMALRLCDDRELDTDKPLDFPCASECVHTNACLASGWDAAADKAASLTKECDVVLYTVQFDGVDRRKPRLHGFPQAWRPDCAVAFVDGADTEMSEYRNWRLVHVGSWGDFTSNPRVASRVPKLSPGKFFPHSRAAVYTDAKLELKAHPEDLLPYVTAPQVAAFAAARHPRSADVFIEGGKILKSRHQAICHDKIKLSRQIEAYREEDATDPGRFVNLIDGAVLIHTLSLPEFRCKWYKEYLAWSDRDQVAFPVVLARAAIMGGSDPHIKADQIAVGFRENADATGNRSTLVRFIPTKMHWYHSSKIAKLRRW